MSTLETPPAHAGAEVFLGKVDASQHTSTLETPPAHAGAEVLVGKVEAGPID